MNITNYVHASKEPLTRKTFKVQGVEDSVKQVITDAYKESVIEIVVMKCHIDRVQLLPNALPNT